MESTTTTGSGGGLQLEVGLQFHRTIDYDRKVMRKTLMRGAAAVRKEARRIVSRRAISAPGEMPGRDSGTLARAIGVISRGSKGGWVKVGVRKTAEMGKDFYPAFLYYGSRKTGLKARGNFMIAALNNKRAQLRAEMQASLAQALVPR